MILQALVRCYEALAERGELEKEGWSPVKGIMAYHAPGADWEEQRAARLAMGFTTPSGRRWRAAESCRGWAEVVDYIHRAAKVCGVVKGYRWYYYGLPF